ncbi:MAG TPA: hypothetical protein VK586_00565, partial [Streptosporangiaceae bacterium]|nr:hypothetical protein [Streptosporangiaceae bacterium]
ERDRPGLLSLAGELAGGLCGDPALLARYGVTRLRITELMARLDTSPVPWLVAVPTDTSGVIAPAVFLERLAAAETGGWEPWPLDLDQALLRTTRSVPPELAARAGALTSPAGRRLARWWSPARVGVTAWDGLIGVLLSRASDPDQVAAPRRSLAPAPHWLAALPHHHEAAAEWLVPLLTGDEDWAERWLMSENDDVRLLLGGGVLGPGLHAVLALRLGALSELRRETAAGILAGLLARPGANGAALGGDIGAAFAAGRASLERALPGLARVAAAQPERMWPVVAAVLPAVMASRHTRAFRLLEIASDLAAHLGRADAVPGLAEAAGGCSTHPLFFAGFATDPLAACRGILALAEVASSDFAFRRPPSGIDPVVTAGEGLLRLESVSRCAGVYARLDLLPAGLNGEIHQHGTTNVETGTQLRLALAQVRRRDPLRLAIGADAVTVSTLTGSVIERKVPLPPRWLRAFTEAQVITATFDLRAELASSEAMRFLQSLPRGRRRDVAWAVPDRRSLRLAAEPVPGAVCLPGPSRLRALTASWRPGTVLQAYGPAVTAASPPAASTWVLATPSARLSLTLSPGVDRGLSGEGAALSSLASPTAMDDADLVAALLAWEPVPDVSALAAASGLTPARVRAGLTVLATCGQIGYDVAEAAYFHRSLPFDTTEAERANPRLAAAKGLVAQGAVRLLGEGAAVTSGAQVY